jgi:hypothetical protein
MSQQPLTPQQKWDKKNRKTVQKSKAEYNRKNPVWGFRPDEEMREWLEEERWNDNNGNPETNAALVIRKLNKLMNMERQGY